MAYSAPSDRFVRYLWDGGWLNPTNTHSSWINNMWWRGDGGGNLWYYDGSSHSWTSWTNLAETVGELRDDPELADPISHDFTLNYTSPCIDAGAYLTQTNGGGTGTVIKVDEASYFFDGYDMINGDNVFIGNDTNLLITDVNYKSNQITVNRSITWIDGENVSLTSYGDKPDIGAIEFIQNEANPFNFSAETPTNGSTVSVSTSSLSIAIVDFHGDTFNWTIETSPNIGNSSGNNASNGSKKCNVSGLAYSTTYHWYVNVTDGTDCTNVSYIFTTESQPQNNQGPGGSNPPPSTPPGSSNNPPVANASAGEPYIGFVGLPVRFNGSWSNDSDGNITKWFWNFGDGTNGSGEIVTHIYSIAGTYTVTLTVTDNDNATDSDTSTVVIHVQNKAPSNPTIDGPTTGNKNVNYSYTALSTDANNDTIKYTFDWGDGNIESSRFLPNDTSCKRNHSWTGAGKYTIKVTATDNQANSSSEKTILIDAVNIGNVGYLTDNDGDGTYDVFHSNDGLVATNVEKQSDGTYLMDINGDGKSDFIYDFASNQVTPYGEKPSKPSGFPWPLAIIGIIIATIAIFVILYFTGYIHIEREYTEKPKTKVEQLEEKPKEQGFEEKHEEHQFDEQTKEQQSNEQQSTDDFKK